MYQHPFNANKALLEDGSTLSTNDSRIRDLRREVAPTRVLDLAGLLDDPLDEYAPPIGEMDGNGVVRFPEDIYALSRASASTWEWSDADIDRYFERMSA